LTFLRFFDVFGGASELAVAALLFEGDVLFVALVSEVALFGSASFRSAILTGEAPFDRRAASVIKFGKWMSEPGAFLGDPQVDVCYGRGFVTHWSAESSKEDGAALEARSSGGTAGFVVEVNEWRRCGLRARGLGECSVAWFAERQEDPGRGSERQWRGSASPTFLADLLTAAPSSWKHPRSSHTD
jgi:hypothetical protein